jgi:hypothetical protein
MSSTNSDFNLQKLSIKDLQEHLKGTIEYGGAIFVVGRRGGGKTASAEAAIAKSNRRKVYLNASTFDRCDAGGYPKILGDNKDDYVRFMLPEYYRALIDGDEPCTVLFDEIDKADTSVLAPLLEFIQKHTINGRGMKNLSSVIMTGNLIAEGGQRPSLPLLDRAEKYVVETSTSHWLDWSAESGEIHPSITAFVNDNPDDLVGEVDPGDVYADASPRGWHNASKIIQFGESRKWSKDLLTAKVAGCVGKKIGIKYASYFEHYVVLLPIVDKIMNGQKTPEFEKLKPSEQLVAVMIVAARLSREIDKKKDLPKVFDVVGNFLQTVDPEVALISLRAQVGLPKLITVMGADGFAKFPKFDAVLESLRRRMFS